MSKWDERGLDEVLDRYIILAQGGYWYASSVVRELEACRLKTEFKVGDRIRPKKSDPTSSNIGVITKILEGVSEPNIVAFSAAHAYCYADDELEPAPERRKFPKDRRKETKHGG